MADPGHSVLASPSQVLGKRKYGHPSAPEEPAIWTISPPPGLHQAETRAEDKNQREPDGRTGRGCQRQRAELLLTGDRLGLPLPQPAAGGLATHARFSSHCPPELHIYLTCPHCTPEHQPFLGFLLRNKSPRLAGDRRPPTLGPQITVPPPLGSL